MARTTRKDSAQDHFQVQSTRPRHPRRPRECVNRRSALVLAVAAPPASTEAEAGSGLGMGNDGTRKRKIKLCVSAAQVTTFALAQEHRPLNVDDQIGWEREPPALLSKSDAVTLFLRSTHCFFHEISSCKIRCFSKRFW